MDNKKINLFYDVSVLGSGVKTNIARTGIFRVCEEILKELIKYPDLNIKLVCDYSNFRYCKKYFKNSNLFNRKDLLILFSVNYFNLIDKKLQKFDKNTNIKIIKIIFKIIFKIIEIIRNLFFPGKREISSFKEKKLKYFNKDDIYFSPFKKIPVIIRNEKTIIKSIIVYDLITIKFPQYFKSKDDVRKLLYEILDNILIDDIVFCISQSTKNDLIEYRKDLSPENIIVIPLAASDKFYRCLNNEKINEIRNKYNIPDDKKYILSLCTLEPRKNIDMLIRSYFKLINEYNINDLLLVLTGVKGWAYDKIFSEIDNVPDIKDKVVFTGYVPDDDLAPLYSGALFFAYPSLYEGFGLPPLEAMQCGTPVITSNNSSLPEVIGDAGIMIDPKQDNELINAMLKLYNDKKLREKLSIKGIERAKLFNWETCTKIIYDTFKNYFNKINSPIN